MTDKWETQVGQLRLVGGVRQERPKNVAVEEQRSLLPVRSRGKGQLYVLIELSGETFGREEMCQELVTALGEEYFHTPGTVTYGLRQAVLLANTQLLRTNSRVAGEHRVGGVACVVLRDGEAFIAQAGWPMIYIVHREHVEAYPDTTLDFEDNSMLGQRQSIEVRLFQSSIQPGDMILVADSPMARQLGSTRIGQIVSGGVAQAMQNLETLAPPEDCTAMVIQVGTPAAQPRAQREQWAFMPVEQPEADLAETQPSTLPSRPIEDRPRQSSMVPAVMPDREGDFVDREPDTEAERRRTGPNLGEQAQAAFALLGEKARTLGERLLPDRTSRSGRRQRRPNRTRSQQGQTVAQPHLGLAAALAIPVIALLIVGAYMLYRNWSTQSQLENKLEAARLKRDIAMGNTESPTLARDDWLEVIALANEALDMQPENTEVQQMLTQAAVEIDRIDGVTRLGPVYKLYEYNTPGSAPSRIIVAGLDVYVLDRGTGRVYHHALNEVRNALRNPTAEQVLIQEAQTIEGQNVGMLVDIAWMDNAGDRQAGALLVLDRNGLLIEYDPTWEQFRVQTLGGIDVWRNPRTLQTFDSNLYLLDTLANQVFKYPAQQFANAPASWLQETVELAGAVDMGIDGSIYILNDNGRVLKYYGGTAVSFDVTRIPKPLLNAESLYIKVEEAAQYIYIGDTSEMRIVQIDREGAFLRQLRPPAETETSFRQLSGLFVDEVGGKLYYTTANTLYVTDLPPIQR